ncbi:MAG: fibronectin type III domain-containing protein [Ignavibacteria bacterium]|nr:fibronectin type III domain-containing protein [Ignavibacteria bacterium]
MKKYISFLLLLIFFAVNYSCTNNETIINPSNNAPSSPRNLIAVSDSSSGALRIKLKWDVPSNNGGAAIIQYIVYKGTTPNNFLILNYISSDTLSFIDSNVIIGNLYYYAISAKNEFGESSKSNVVNLSVNQTFFRPTEPTNFACLPGNSKVTMNWNTPFYNGGSNIVNYKIYKGTTPNNLVVLITLNESTFSYVDSSVINFNPYYYQISASNNYYEGVRSNLISVSPTPVNSNVTFTMQGQANGANYSFYFQPSVDVKVSRIIANLPAQPYSDTINTNTNYVFSKDTAYTWYEYQGIATGQVWNFVFSGQRVSDNNTYTSTSYFSVP